MGGEEEKPKEKPNQQADDSIRVICRVRPLNKSEEAAGSKFVTSFPSSRGQEDQMVSVGVKDGKFCVSRFLCYWIVGLVELIL
ncbi:hypothetical protein Pmani_031804 [Petrolisthes manimaculis]|uniref:Kinesin motor domain-containing protein n=1 Tax=Petrolisthes manimaculis TaxID=1843537 RepID=A0AAE1NUP2_9EUCA|nr:hypothetical protein Pmani_031804 [Petrolisthes manimaculis]